MSTLLTSIGTILTSMLDWTGDVLELIAEQPLLLLGVVGTFGLVGVGIVKRLLRL